MQLVPPGLHNCPRKGTPPVRARRQFRARGLLDHREGAGKAPATQILIGTGLQPPVFGWRAKLRGPVSRKRKSTNIFLHSHPARTDTAHGPVFRWFILSLAAQGVRRRLTNRRWVLLAEAQTRCLPLFHRIGARDKNMSMTTIYLLSDQVLNRRGVAPTGRSFFLYGNWNLMDTSNFHLGCAKNTYPHSCQKCMVLAHGTFRGAHTLL